MKVLMLQTVTNSYLTTVYHAGRSYDVSRDVAGTWCQLGFCEEVIEEVKMVSAAPGNKMEASPVENKKRNGRKKGA